MTGTIDLTAALHAFYALPRPERDGAEELHASDLCKCKRAVWSRRNHEPQIGKSPETLMKFALGNAVESHVAEAIEQQLGRAGWTVHHNRKVEYRGVIGHPDFYLVRDDAVEANDSAIVEVKSTTFFPQTINGKKTRIPPTREKVSRHYVQQAAFYALAEHAPRFAVFIVCRESGMVAEHWYDTRDYVNEIEALIDQHLAETKPGAPEPAAEPPAAWWCGYCDASACSKNKNAEAMVLR